MEKMMKCLLLKNNQVIISKIEEIDAELGDPNCKLTDPYMLLQNGEVIKWLDFTDQNEILVRSEDVLTVVDPKPAILEKYLSEFD